MIGDDGTITYEQQKTYKINRAQAANLINFINSEGPIVPILEAGLEDYAYTPLAITTEEDFLKCKQLINTDGNPVVLYYEDPNNAGKMAIASDYEQGITYYNCH